MANKIQEAIDGVKQGFNLSTKDKVIEITCTLDTNAYADGDVLADTQEISEAVLSGGSSILQSICLLDKDDQGGELDVLILRSNQSVGTENSEISVTDTEAEEILTAVPISLSDYVDLVNNQVAVKNGGDDGMGAVLEPTSGTSLYFALVSRGAKTYTANGLIIKFGFLRA